MSGDGTRKAGSPANVHAPTRHEFDAFMRLAGSSLGEPPWFAAPVDAKEDADSYAVAFHVAGYDRRDLAVTAAANAVIVWGLPRGEGERREKRICTLPGLIDSRSLEVVHDGDMLTVRVRKKGSEGPRRGKSTR
jgi:HSP20 family molecular chaperone IbpA